MNTASFDLAAPSRYVPFKNTAVFFGDDLTGAAFAMQVRDRRDGGALRADLAAVADQTVEGVCLIYAGTDTVENHVTAGYFTEDDAAAAGYELADTVLISVIGIRIDQATMEALPLAPTPGDDKAFYYDLRITPAGGDGEILARGKFNVSGGVTQ